MHFALSDEQNELVKALTSLLDRHADPTSVRAAIDSETGFDPILWRVLTEEIGVAALAVPEEFGGAGFSWFETALVLESLGYSLAPTPLLASSILATGALLGSGNHDACERLLPGIAEGSTLATIAWADAAQAWRIDGSDVRATRSGDEWTLEGASTLVLDAQGADVVLVVAGVGDSVGVFEVIDLDMVTRTRTSAVDPALRFSTLTFSGTSARAVLLDAEEVLKALLDQAAVAVACLQVGVARRGLDMTVEYSRQRVQFGRQIGSFQALKHRMADMLVQVETARTVAWAAAWSVSENAPDVAERAALAKAWCSDALDHVAGETVQLHGGIAITWEHDAQLIFKRAHALGQLFGSASAHRSRYGALADLR